MINNMSGVVRQWKLAALSLVAMAALAPSGRNAVADVSIDTSFPGGNVEVISNDGNVVQIRPDLRGDSAWFYWCFDATAKQAGRVTFAFPEKVAGFKRGAIGFQGPAVSTDQGKTWRWMGTEQVVENSFSYDFDEAKQQVRFAVTIPYLQANLEQFLAKNADNPHLKRSVLTRSRNGRDVELLQIGAPAEGKKPVLATARHHAAESMASYVLEGFLQEAMLDSPAGEAFRRKHVLFAVPFVDKDGVEEGDQGKNRKPHDHNRDYGPESIYPEIRAIKELDKKHDFHYSLDFHCPTLVMPDHQVMYFVGAKDHPRYNHENIAELAAWIKKGLPASAPAGPMNWLRPAKEPVPMNSHYFGFKPGAVVAATLEFPFAPPGKDTAPESCRKYGGVVLEAWVNTHFVADTTPEGAKPSGDSKPPAKSNKPADFTPPAETTAPGPGKQAWRPATVEEHDVSPVTITPTPKATADASKFDKQYVIDLEKFHISNEGKNPTETSRGVNQALQHAKKLGANHIVFPPGTYLISETDPVVLDHQNTIIDLNGATMQINANGLQKYSIVEIVDGAENLRLTNGVIRGDEDVHDYAAEKGVHAWGHGLIVHAGRNLELDHLTATNVTGDGVNTRFTGARTRDELLANILYSVYPKELEHGAFAADGQKIVSADKIRSSAPFNLAKCDGQFEFGYSTGYLGYPFIQSRAYAAYFYDADMKFLERQTCLQFHQVEVPNGAKFVHFEFDQPEIPDTPLHAGAAKGSFVGRITQFKGSADVHFHDNKLIGNRRLGMGYCGGRRWLIEDNLFAGNGGVAPSYGIDLEDGWEFMQDVVIRNNRFRDNKAGDLVICAGTELLIEGNTFANNVVVHGRPHNYTFRNNQFNGGRVGFKTRTGVANIHDNTYRNCSLSIVFDTAAVADGLKRLPGETVATPPLLLEHEKLHDVKEVVGTYFNFVDSTMENVKFIAGKETSLIRLENCGVQDSSIEFEKDGPQVTTELDGSAKLLTLDGPGLKRRSTSP